MCRPALRAGHSGALQGAEKDTVGDYKDHAASALSEISKMSLSPMIIPSAEMIRLAFPTQPYIQAGLGPVLLHLEDFEQLKFVHHSTTSLPPWTPNSVKAYGSTIWFAGTEEERCVALTWNYVLFPNTVVGLADPLTVASNCWLVDEMKSPLTDASRFRALHRAVHSLEWQAQVLEELSQ